MSPTPTSVIELLQALVRIPSVNPDGDPGTTEVGEKRCAEYVGEFLIRCGANVEYQEVEPDRPNVIGKFPSHGKEKPRLLFVPHLDTVSVSGMVIDPFSGELRDGRVWGRGASDTKGPMAAMLWTLFELREHLADFPYEIWFVGTMGEEAGLDGSSAFVEWLIKEDPNAPETTFAVIGEPTHFEIVHATKGFTCLDITTSGKAVHASQPSSGENAIYKMADILNVIRHEIVPGLSAQRHPELGEPTVSVGVIQGGTKVNIVPDCCRIQLDMRTVPGQDIEAVSNRLREVCPDVRISPWSSDPMYTDPSHVLIDKLAAAGGTVAKAAWFCDAALFGRAGIPAVAVGPGSINQAHTKDEFMSVAELEDGVAYYRRFLEGLQSSVRDT